MDLLAMALSAFLVSLAATSTVHASERVWTPQFPHLRTSKRFELELLNFDRDGMSVPVAAVWIGTPPQAFHLAVDWWTGECGVVIHNERHLPYYNHSRSTSFRPNGTHVGSGAGLTGDAARDRIALGRSVDGVALDDSLFVEVTNDNFQGLRGYQGSCGLGYRDGRSTGTPSFMRELIRQGRLAQPVIGVFFAEVGGTAHLTVGGVDNEKIDGDDAIQYVDVAPSIWSDWRLPMNGILVGEKQIPSFSDQTIVLDGHSNHLAGPAEQVSAIADALGADTFVLPCDGPLPDITLQVGGIELTMTKDQYLRRENGVCTLGLLANVGEPTWYVGMGRHPEVYTVLEYSETPGHERVGFARAVHT